MKRHLVVSPEGAGARVDVYLAHTLQLTRNALKRLLAAGAVRFEGRAVSKSQTFAPGAVLEVDLAQAEAQLEPNPALPLEVLFEDEALLVLNKPAGLACYPLRAGQRETVANALVARYPSQAGASSNPLEAGLCHRLDTPTSGLLLAARNPQAYGLLRAAFSARQIYKRYVGLCEGALPEEGVVATPLVQQGRRSRPASPDNPRARAAHTRFCRMEQQGAYALVSVEISTGVMHQIRAHLAGLGAPLVGDALYGSTSPHCPRLFLHAAELGFCHPLARRQLRFEAPLPTELRAVLEKLGFGFAGEGCGASNLK